MTHSLLLLAKVLTLADALHTAQAAQPQLRQARANTAAALARVNEARSAFLPSVSGTASYQRSTANYVSRPGALPPSSTVNSGGLPTSIPNPTGTSYDFFSLSTTVSQLIYDSQQSIDHYRAMMASGEALAATEKAVRLQIELTVRTAFFNARAQKELIGVAKQTLENQDKHVAQIEGFVEVGTRPAIDLAQARTDRANAKVQLINAENGYLVAKALLNQAMGVDQMADYDVADDTLPPIEGEDRSTDEQLPEALKTRPDVISLVKQVRAQQLTLQSTKDGYGPSVQGQFGISDQGTDLGALRWNWNASVSVGYSVFDGFLVWSQVKEQAANLDAVGAQLELSRQQVRLDIEQARLAVRAARETLVAAGEALTNAHERLGLAEGRYETGIGSVIELGDAQVAFTSAAAQRVQADYNLSSARAQLIRALGRI